MLPIFLFIFIDFFYEPKEGKTSIEDRVIQLGWHLPETITFPNHYVLRTP